MKCKICDRKTEQEGFCSFHFKAFQNINDKFSRWDKASEISWNEYLIMIQKNSLTGKWAKEVAKHLIEEEKRNVTQNKERF